MATDASVATAHTSQPEHFIFTSGETDPVWIHHLPYKSIPRFSKLDQDVETDVCIVGAGFSGVSGREVLSGETGSTSCHLANDLDDGYPVIAKKHGDKGAKAAAESHTWALNRVGEISKQLDIECEYRHLPGYDFSQYPKGSKDHADDIQVVIEEGQKVKELGIATEYREGFKLKGWKGNIDQSDAVIYPQQTTFHPTKYVVGVLEFLKQQPNFSCYTNTCCIDVQEKGVEILGMGHKDVYVKTMEGHTTKCADAVEAICVPLQKLSVIAEEEYFCTYCITIRIPKGSVEDALFYDSAEIYKYVRLTECDDKDDYMVVGGGDHKLDPRCSRWKAHRRLHHRAAQLVNFCLYVQFIFLQQNFPGLNDPKRLVSIAKSATSMISHDLQINSQYKCFLQSDITDIEDLAPGEGGVLNTKTSKPLAVYKDEGGQIRKFSALCPHLKGVVCWNSTEKSWDFPVHGSRFSKDGIQLCGPSKMGLEPANESGEALQQQALKY
ncbi:FAD dependent oxidoreductase-like protein [Clathrospora elynae]|uniref:FAD dependent oxidoreductase-like protein n=1 Tax=Clathrospora elynae TaxID=706981 RepID=A0A6A5SRW8_9PLEO|nr:FAD dependent oxidoreductase-like protein [Clathrospora elynae]